MWRLGLRPLDLADWIELDANYAADLAVKATVRREHPDTVFVALPDALAACDEVLATLVDHLIDTWPHHFQRQGDVVHNVQTGEQVGVDGSLHPLDAASRLVQEDLVVMIERHGELVFGAGSVCFPNRWDLRSKLGLPLREVHAPVSLLNEQLGDTIDRFFDRLTPDRSFWRLGWGVLDSVDLYQPLDGTAAPRPATPGPGDLVVRVERETLRRFPRTGCVLFTIRTHLAKAAELAADPRHGPVIAEALAAMPPAVRQYKQVDRVTAAVAELFAATLPRAGRATCRSS
ncbi:MAG: hypothetical protein K0S92_343 [Desertimonas sp.]|nr:hypothetical protein [Desertimonas sp.]